MSESKILKAKCGKTGLEFALELKKFGSTWKVVNFVPISEEESKIIASEISQPVFLTNENLVPCRNCGSRKVSGCSCSRKKHSCSPSMKYQFDCVYCDALSIDYSRPTKKSPYTQWAGISNIPGAIKDHYGNPAGSQYDLAQDNSFQGYKVIVIFLEEEKHANFKQPAAALQRKGFETILFKVPPSPGELQKILSAPRTQLWIISDCRRKLTVSHVDVIEKYFNSGHGIYIWGDNDPYYVDANQILERLFGTYLFGDKCGDKVLGIQQGQGEPGLIPNHPITTGIMNFYEGITISEIKLGFKQSWFFQKEIPLKPLMYGSERQVVTAYYDQDQKRALVDGGFTRLYVKWDTAGTDRFIVNSAAWLANIERFGYSQGNQEQ